MDIDKLKSDLQLDLVDEKLEVETRIKHIVYFLLDEIKALLLKGMTLKQVLSHINKRSNSNFDYKLFNQHFCKVVNAEERKHLYSFGLKHNKLSVNPSIAKPVNTTSNSKNPSISKPILASSNTAKSKVNELENPKDLDELIAIRRAYLISTGYGEMLVNPKIENEIKTNFFVIKYTIPTNEHMTNHNFALDSNGEIITRIQAISNRRSELSKNDLTVNEITNLIKTEVSSGDFDAYPEDKDIPKKQHIEINNDDYPYEEKKFLFEVKQCRGNIDAVKDSFKHTTRLRDVLNTRDWFEDMIYKHGSYVDYYKSF